MRSRYRRHVFTFLVLALAAASTPGLAAPVGSSQAQEAVARWLQLSPTPLNAPMSSHILDVSTQTDAQGRALFHVVKLEPQGFVVVASDDNLEPIIAFSATGSFDPHPCNPLFDILTMDMTTRLDGLKGVSPVEQQPTSVYAEVAPAYKKWEFLQGYSNDLNLEQGSTPTLDDLRVDAIVQSKWNQGSSTGGSTTPYCYNYYTPNHWPSGCVATAMGQIMRYYQFPTTPIGVRSFTYEVGGASTTGTTRGGDGSGGAYTWSSMPLTTNSSTGDPERQMIGSLLWDAGLSVGMDYASSGSGSDTLEVADSLKTLFGYGSAIKGYVYGMELVGNGLYEMVNAGLDAGLPSQLGITGSQGGHSIVCDGYGYNAGTMYHHLNMGWSGSNDTWYDLPNIGTGYGFYTAYKCVYNISPTVVGEILSGRVTDTAGSPVQGATITCGSLSTTSNAKGIYALRNVASGLRTVTATKTGMTFPEATRMVGTSQDYVTVGNRWNVNLSSSVTTPTIQTHPLSQKVQLGSSGDTFLVEATGTATLHYQWTKNGTTVGSDSPTYSLGTSTRADNNAAIRVQVSNSAGNLWSNTATVLVLDLWNGDFERGYVGWTFSDPNMVWLANSTVVPHGGLYWLYLGDWTSPTTDYVTQNITIPANATTANLSLWLGIANKSSTPSTVANTFNVKIQNQAGTADLATLYTKNNTHAELSGGKVVWKSSGALSLMAYAGQTVKLRIESVQTGGTNTGTIFAVDDVNLSIAVKTLDTNGDSVIDLQDLLRLAGDWGSTESRSCLSGGATVGDADLALLLTGLGF